MGWVRDETGRILHRDYDIELERNAYSWPSRRYYPPAHKIISASSSLLLSKAGDRRAMRTGGYRRHLIGGRME